MCRIQHSDGWHCAGTKGPAHYSDNSRVHLRGFHNLICHGGCIGRCIPRAGNQEANQHTAKLHTIVVLFLCKVGSLEIITANADVCPSEHSADNKGDIRATRGHHALIFQVDKRFGIITLITPHLKSLLPKRRGPPAIERLELVCRLALENAIGPAGVKGKDSITNANVLPIRGFGDTNARNWWQGSSRSCSASATTHTITDVGQSEKNSSNDKDDQQQQDSAAPHITSASLRWPGWRRDKSHPYRWC